MTGSRDRVQGVLLGLAAGDRIGGPTQMAVRLAESLSEHGRVVLDDIAGRYLDWWREGAFDTGPTTARVLALVDAGLSFREAATQVHQETRGLTAGCNPAHRSAPLAMLPGLSPCQLAQSSKEEATLTHAHPFAGDAAAAVVALCSELVRGSEWQDAVDSALAGRLPETQAAMRNRNAGTLRTSGFAPDVLSAAVYFVGTSDSFDHALTAAVRFAGPANYSPVLVGSLGGARWGASSIPPMWLQDCPILSHIRTVALALASKWPSGSTEL